MNLVKRFVERVKPDSYRHAARILGVTQSNFSDWVNNKRDVPDYIGRQISLYFEMSQAQIDRKKEYYR